MADRLPALQVEVVDDVAGFDGLREEWRLLHARTIPRNVFSSYAWSRTWWRHFGEERSLYLVTVRDRDRLVALAPLELARLAFGPFSVRALQLIGTAGVRSRGMGLSDRADFLVEPDRSDALDQLIRTIVEDRTWGVLLLRGVPEHSPTGNALQSAHAGDRVIWKRRRRSSSYVLELPDDWDVFVGSKSARWRKTYRAQTNRAERSGRVDFERFFPCSPQELQGAWETVVALQRSSWKSDRGTGLMQLDALEAFFRDVTTAAAEEKLLDLTIARLDGKPFAYEMYLSTPETAGAYDGTYHSEMAHLSPGILITGFLIRDSIERGMKAFDFMRGDEPYKRRWGGQERHEEQLAAYRCRRPGALAAMAAIEGKAFLKRFPRIEQLSDRATGVWVKWKTRQPAVSDAHWSFFLPAGPDVSLLELGSGTGERSCRLARACGRLETLSFSEGQVRVVTERVRSSGLDNVHPHRYQPGSPLEFDDAEFDAVILDRLLGYPASCAGDTERLLAEAFRVLAVGGVLYVGVENRLYHLLGLGVVFGALRKSTAHRDSDLEANLAALGNDGRARRLTLGAYARALRSAGFSDVRAFAPLPGAVRPQAVVTLKRRESQRFLFRQRVRRHSFQTRAAATLGGIAVGTGLLPRVVPYYYLVASK